MNFSSIIKIFCTMVIIAVSITGCRLKSDDENVQQVDRIKTNVELTYWLGRNSNLVATGMELNDTPFAKKLEEKTGVKVRYIHPPDLDSSKRFELILASGNMPDIMEWDWYNYPGGAQKALDDGYIIKLNELFKKYSPNLMKALDENPTMKEMITSYNGSYYGYPFLLLNLDLYPYGGLMLRKDWLDELSLSVPETIDEWYRVLSDFKNKKGVVSPLCFQGSTVSFMGAFGITKGFYRNDFTIKFGEIDPGYKEHLKVMHKWYAEGLLHKDFGNMNKRAIDVMIMEGKAGAVYGLAGSNMGRWTEMLRQRGDGFQLVAAPNPTLVKGEYPEFGQINQESNCSTALTSNCKSPELAAKYLDYAYGKEGHMLFNFGIENESYIMERGEPKYTDLIVNNPDGLAFGQALSIYARASYNGPFIQDKRYLMQYYELPEQKEAVRVWGHGALSRHLLPYLTFTPEESEELASITHKVKEYVNEMELKFIFGAVPIEAFDDYVAKVKSMKIDRAIEIQNNAYIRYRNK